MTETHKPLSHSLLNQHTSFQIPKLIHYNYITTES